MKTVILGGFLGAGKTTVLLHMVPALAEGSQSPHPVVVLENEISTTDVDARLLRGRGMQVKSLSAGCVCCTSSAQLSDSLEDIRREFDPDYLAIETTGMACPDAVAAIVRESGQETVIAAVVDVSRWAKLVCAMPQFVHGQLHEADAIYLNKLDLVSSQETDSVYAEVRTLAPRAAIYPVSALSGMDEACFERLR